MDKRLFLVGVLMSPGCHSADHATPGSSEAEAPAPSESAANPNALGLPPEKVAGVVNPMKLPAYAGRTATVEGTVLVRGPAPPDVPGLDFHACPAAIDTYGKLFRVGPARADGLRPLADAVVVVTGYSGFYLPETEEVHHATIKASCGYETRTITMTFGQRLEIENESAIPFAPYLEGEPTFTTMVAAPERKGEAVKIFVARADYYSLKDKLQPFVREDLYVLRQPLHAVTDVQGHFRIGGVPTGKLTVSARLAAAAGETAKEIDVHEEDVGGLELVLTYAPKPSSSSARPQPPASEAHGNPSPDRSPARTRAEGR